MTLSVSVHVVLSHGGRADLLDGVPRLLVAVAALLALALACRLLVDLDPAHFNLWLGIAAASFLAATVCWARLVLRRPRTAQFPAPPLHPTRLSGDSMRRLWIAFVAVVLASFAVFGWVGTRI